MDIKDYEIKGEHKDTGRSKKLKISAISILKCKSIATEKGLLEPYEITELSPRIPTERQIEYAKDLGISIPEGATFYEASDLISRKVENDNSDPSKGLIDFANNHEMPFSKYIGKRSLYNLVFNSLSGKNKIAFFIFCVYRWLSDDRGSNLDTHNYKNTFYEIAETLTENDKFIKSMNRYRGEDIRFFGEIRSQNGTISKGGSTNTIAYKIAVEIVCKEFQLKNREVKLLPNNDELISDINKKSRSGCLGMIMLMIILNIGLITMIKIL